MSVTSNSIVTNTIASKSGTFTPVLTFTTPGDLSVAYSTQIGAYTKIGNMVYVDLRIVTSTFTHTTAGGTLLVGGLPFTSSATHKSVGSMIFSGITKATYTNFVPSLLLSTTDLRVRASGTAVADSNVAPADMPTGGSVVLQMTIAYRVD